MMERGREPMDVLASERGMFWDDVEDFRAWMEAGGYTPDEAPIDVLRELHDEWAGEE